MTYLFTYVSLQSFGQVSVCETPGGVSNQVAVLLAWYMPPGGEFYQTHFHLGLIWGSQSTTAHALVSGVV